MILKSLVSAFLMLFYSQNTLGQNLSSKSEVTKINENIDQSTESHIMRIPPGPIPTDNFNYYDIYYYEQTIVKTSKEKSGELQSCNMIEVK